MDPIIYCAFDPAKYLFISPEVSPLIYYSHLIAGFAALSISLLVYLHNPKLLVSKLFLAFAVVFGTWTFLDVILWATNDPGIVMFAWSVQVLAEPALFAIAFYLFYVFIYKAIPPLWLNIVIFAALLPLVALLPTSLNLEAVSLAECESKEGLLALYYTYILNGLFTALTVWFGFKQIGSLEANHKRSAKFIAVGLVTFLLSFTVANMISSITDNWNISQYGLFGMPVFAGLVAYSIVQFRTFTIHIAGAQVLVVALFGLVAASFFVKEAQREMIAFGTLFLTAIVGYFLVKGVKKEFEQKLELERLAAQLDKANKRLKVLDKMKSEFVSIASHQLRSPLTSIRGYASMILEGSYGKVPKKVGEAIERIAESTRLMTMSVEDYLNVSRIQAGNMKYEISRFNVNEMVEKVVDGLRREAMHEGLLLSYENKLKNSDGTVKADEGKVNQILHNLIDNAMKYTEKGAVTVIVSDSTKPKRVNISVKDTGIGMDPETIDDMFEKFERADNANSVNVSGTGLGLYIARKMSQDMGGDITATSEGEGKGSTFTLSLPV